MFKRIVSGALAAVLLAGLCSFTGCGKKDDAVSVKFDPKNPVVISLWHYYNGPQKIAFDTLIDEFNETVGLEQGIVVEPSGQGSIPELTEKVIDAANKKVGAEDIPNIFAAYADTAYQVDQMGLVADLKPYLTQEELSEYVPGFIEEGRLTNEEEFKIFPTAKSTEVFMLNKTDWDKFAAATGASTSSLKTMEGVAQIARQYYDWSGGKAFFGRDAMANYFIIGCKQLGKELFEVSDGSVKLNCDEAVMRRLWDNYYIPYISGYFASYGKFRSDDAKTGDIIALVGSTSGAAYFPDTVMVGDTETYPIEVAVLPAPVFEGGEQVAVQQGAGMVVSKSDKSKEYASIVFLKWFTEQSRNIDFSIESGYLPVKTSANQADVLTQALDKLTDSAITTNLKATLPVAANTVASSEMYTNKAFKNGTAARAVLENSMQDKAEQDLKTVHEQMQQGVPHDEAVAMFDTDENFHQWLESFCSQLEQTVAQK